MITCTNRHSVLFVTQRDSILGCVGQLGICWMNGHTQADKPGGLDVFLTAPQTERRKMRRDSATNSGCGEYLTKYDQGFSSCRGWEFVSSPPRPDWFWVPPSLLYSGYQGLFLAEVKQAGHEADHLPPTGAKVKNVLSYTSNALVHLHGVLSQAKGQLYLLHICLE